MYEARLFQHKNGTDHIGLDKQADLGFGLESRSGVSGALELDTPNAGKTRLLTGKPGSRTTTNR